MHKILEDAINLLKMPDAKRRAVNSIVSKKFTEYDGVSNHNFDSVLRKIGKNKSDLTNYEELAIKKLLKGSNLRDITKDEVDKMSGTLKKDIDLQAKFKVGVDWFKEPAKKIIDPSATNDERSLAKAQLAMRVGAATVGTIAAGKFMHDLDSKDTLLGKLGYSSKDAMHFAIDRISKL